MFSHIVSTNVLFILCLDPDFYLIPFLFSWRKSFHISCTADLLVMNYFSVYISEMALFHLHCWKIFLRSTEFYLPFFFPYYFKDAPQSSHLCCLWWKVWDLLYICASVCNMSFYLAAFDIISLILNNLITCYAWCNFHHVSHAWSFFSLWVYSYYP